VTYGHSTIYFQLTHLTAQRGSTLALLPTAATLCRVANGVHISMKKNITLRSARFLAMSTCLAADMDGTVVASRKGRNHSLHLRGTRLCRAAFRASSC